MKKRYIVLFLALFSVSTIVEGMISDTYDLGVVASLLFVNLIIIPICLVLLVLVQYSDDKSFNPFIPFKGTKTGVFVGLLAFLNIGILMRHFAWYNI